MRLRSRNTYPRVGWPCSCVLPRELEQTGLWVHAAAKRPGRIGGHRVGGHRRRQWCSSGVLAMGERAMLSSARCLRARGGWWREVVGATHRWPRRTPLGLAPATPCQRIAIAGSSVLTNGRGAFLGSWRDGAPCKMTPSLWWPSGGAVAVCLSACLERQTRISRVFRRVVV